MVKDEKGHIRILFHFRQYMKRGDFPEEVGEVVVFFKNTADNQTIHELPQNNWQTLSPGVKADFVNLRLIITPKMDRLHYRIRLSEKQIANYRGVYEHILLLFTKVVAFICSNFLTSNTECSQNLYNSAYG